MRGMQDDLEIGTLWEGANRILQGIRRLRIRQHDTAFFLRELYQLDTKSLWHPVERRLWGVSTGKRFFRPTQTFP